MLPLPNAEWTAEALRGDPVAMAGMMVATPSVNPTLADGGHGEGGMADLTSSWLNEWGFRVETIEVADGRFNVVATIEGEGPTVLFNGHLDTVGIEGMTIDPFGAAVADGRMSGRGSCDMKGGVASLLAASHRLSRRDDRPNLIVALTADEEYGSLGMAHFAESMPPADCAVVCEPTSLAVMPAHKGFVWLKAAFQGRAAHGSRPDLGIDAIRHAALYLGALDGYAEELRSRPRHPLLDWGSLHAGTIRGGSAESVYPDICELLLERRTMPGEVASDVLAEFQAVLDRVGAKEVDLRATLDVTLEQPGTEVPDSSPLVRGLLAAAASNGIDPRVEGMTAWVDAALLNVAGVPAVCFGPGDIAQAHTEDEWIEISQIRSCADVLTTFALGFGPAR